MITLYLFIYSFIKFKDAANEKEDKQCLLDTPAQWWSIKKTTIENTKAIQNG